MNIKNTVILLFITFCALFSFQLLLKKISISELGSNVDSFYETTLSNQADLMVQSVRNMVVTDFCLNTGKTNTSSNLKFTPMTKKLRTFQT